MKNDLKFFETKVSALLEAMPFMYKFSNYSFVIKIGGQTLKNKEFLSNFASSIVLMKKVGIHPIIVHGGGPQITQMMEQLDIEAKFISGIRVTTQESVNIVEMALNQVNKEIVIAMNRAGGSGVGICGKDGNLISVQRKYLEDSNGNNIDIGYVGKPEFVNTSILETLNQADFIPVISPISANKEGESYNVNADHVAGAIAKAIQAEKLIMMSDVRGVLNQDGTLFQSLNSEEVKSLIETGVISGGMIPKITTCLDVLSSVNSAHIIDSRIEHSLFLEIFTEDGIGTKIIS